MYVSHLHCLSNTFCKCDDIFIFLLQPEVFDRVMDPLLVDFMSGKSSLLVAMGATGSGKTHTMFGCPRDPGMVPLALKKIFSYAVGNAARTTDDNFPRYLVFTKMLMLVI